MLNLAKYFANLMIYKIDDSHVVSFIKYFLPGKL